MRLATIRTRFGSRAARIGRGGCVAALPYPDVGALLADRSWREGSVAGGAPVGRFDDVDMAPVVPEPPKIVCLGLNYRARADELGLDIPDHPMICAKFADALVGPKDDIVLPGASAQADWEVELGVVVGEPLLQATREEAARAVAGYTIVNDVSMRDWQERSGEWLQGKNFGASTPVGPVLVTPDELPHRNGVVDVEIRLEVDGELHQCARTSDLLFTPVDILVHLSGILPLRPGDLIATGTPGGAGVSQCPQAFLKPGQVVRSAAEGIGECVNTCVPED